MSLRLVTGEDREYLFQLYASTRQEEMASWGWDATQQAGFIRMQFEARQRGYAAAYPTAKESLIFVADVLVGAMIVFQDSREIRLVDIALLPDARNRGIGTHVIGMLISESTCLKIPLRLSVLKGNRAIHLYERLGFTVKTGDEMYYEMEYAQAHAG